MADGVSIIDPNNTYVDTTVTIGRDTVLYPGTILEGHTVIGEDCHIGPYVRMTNVQMGDDDHVQFMYAHDCQIKNGCEVGPFVHFRPDTVIGNHVKVGNYMEVKNSTIGDGTKLPHRQLYRGQRCRSERQYRLWDDYRQLRRQDQTPYDHRRPCLCRLQQQPRGPGYGRDYAYVGAGSTITKTYRQNPYPLPVHGSAISKAGLKTIHIRNNTSPPSVYRFLYRIIYYNIHIREAHYELRRREKAEDFTGNANPELAKEIVEYLGLELGKAFVGKFNNGEIQVMIDESVRGKDVFVIQPTCNRLTIPLWNC